MVAQHPQDRIINNVAEEEDEDAAKDCLIVANAFRQASVSLGSELEQSCALS